MTTPALRIESERLSRESRQDSTTSDKADLPETTNKADLPETTNKVTAMYGSVSYEWQIKSAHRRPPWEADDLE